MTILLDKIFTSRMMEYREKWIAQNKAPLKLQKYLQMVLYVSNMAILMRGLILEEQSHILHKSTTIWGASAIAIEMALFFLLFFSIQKLPPNQDRLGGSFEKGFWSIPLPISKCQLAPSSELELATSFTFSLQIDIKINHNLSIIKKVTLSMTPMSTIMGISSQDGDILGWQTITMNLICTYQEYGAQKLTI